MPTERERLHSQFLSLKASNCVCDFLKLIMVANVYKKFYNPNYLLIFFYSCGLFFLSPLATHSTKLLFWPWSCVCFCYLSCLCFGLCLGWILAGFWLAFAAAQPRHT